jgi:hypothetical protein
MSGYSDWLFAREPQRISSAGPPAAKCPTAVHAPDAVNRSAMSCGTAANKPPDV